MTEKNRLQIRSEKGRYRDREREKEIFITVHKTEAVQILTGVLRTNDGFSSKSTKCQQPILKVDFFWNSLEYLKLFEQIECAGKLSLF